MNEDTIALLRERRDILKQYAYVDWNDPDYEDETESLNRRVHEINDRIVTLLEQSL